MPHLRRLNTTSYAILGLLAVKPWSAYELAQQMQRSLSFIWPRAVSALYEEPKNLVDHGLARATTERRGQQERTRYSITAKGRRALGQWLAEPSEPPTFQSEAAVRVMFGDLGSKEELLATIEQLEKQANEMQQLLLGMAQAYLDDAGPFPERAHVNATVGRLCHEHAQGLQRWCSWARDEVAKWPDTGADAASRAPRILRENLRDFSEITPRTRR